MNSETRKEGREEEGREGRRKEGGREEREGEREEEGRNKGKERGEKIPGHILELGTTVETGVYSV